MAMFESLIELRDLGIGSGEFFAAEVQIIDIDNFTKTTLKKFTLSGNEWPPPRDLQNGTL